MRDSRKAGIGNRKRQERDEQTAEDLATELYAVVGNALRQLGVSPAARGRALERADGASINDVPWNLRTQMVAPTK